MRRKLWTRAEDARLRRDFADTPTKALATALDRSVSCVYQRAYTLGLRKSEAYLASPAACRLRRGDSVGWAHRFQAGHATWNKGTHFTAGGRSIETRFKPGVRLGVAAQNWCPIGTIRTDTEGYQRIKVREATKGEYYGFGNVRVWPLLQRHVWEQAHGPIPHGHNIVFKDGNKQNCDLANLECVSRADMMRRNSYHRYGKDIARTIQLIGAVTRQINKRDREKQDRRSA